MTTIRRSAPVNGVAQTNMTTTLLILLCLGAGLMAGVFFAFSCFVMQALAQLPASQGIAAMQRINVVVLNPLFLGVFGGTTILAVIALAVGSLPWQFPVSALQMAAGLAYAGGVFGVTAAANVPRNEHLAKLPADSAEALAYWPQYLSEWLFWNHVRTLAGLLSAACAAAALAC